MNAKYDDIVKYVLVNEEEIVKMCKELGEKITKDYMDKDLVVVGMLKGATPFMMELIKHIKLPINIDFIQTSSYHGTTQSSACVLFKKDIDTDIREKHVLLVDDVIDTARTITKVIDVFKDRGALSLELCCLLDKPEGRVVEYEAKYVGKVIPNEFVIGYGLDYNELYRNLPYVAVVKDEVYK